LSWEWLCAPLALSSYWAQAQPLWEVSPGFILANISRGCRWPVWKTGLFWGIIIGVIVAMKKSSDSN
jgi:hypothetical protein